MLCARKVARAVLCEVYFDDCGEVNNSHIISPVMAQYPLTPRGVQSLSPVPGPFAGVSGGNISPTGAALSPVPGPFGGVGGGIISPTGAAFAFSVPGPLGVGGGTISPTGATPNSFRTPGQNSIEANGGPFNEPSASVLPPSLPFTTQLYADIM